MLALNHSAMHTSRDLRLCMGTVSLCSDEHGPAAVWAPNDAVQPVGYPLWSPPGGGAGRVHNSLITQALNAAMHPSNIFTVFASESKGLIGACSSVGAALHTPSQPRALFLSTRKGSPHILQMKPEKAVPRASSSYVGCIDTCCLIQLFGFV